MSVRRGYFYYRRHVPQDVQEQIGLVEIWRPLRTDSLRTALRRIYLIAAQVEAEIEMARKAIGLSVDETLLGPWVDDLSLCSAKLRATHLPDGGVPISQSSELRSDRTAAKGSVTFGEAYDRYLTDPTHSWAARTREAFNTSRKTAVSVIGADTPLMAFSRAHCRSYIEVLRHLPRNAAKRFPNLTPQQASDRARLTNDGNVISSANVNVYLGNLSSFLNWAVNEELLDRNPARGLRLHDETAKKNKRYPFSSAQLRMIFNAPIYRGCLDGDRGYATPGDERPRNARFWVPLIGLHTGMRLNEICQLDVADVRLIDGVNCIIVSEKSVVGSADKSLKTSASERVIPLHRNLIDCGLTDFVALQRRHGKTKLFDEIDPGTKGIRAVAFSKWFTQFLRACNAYRERTCFHSFRHNFRDELRAARVDHDVAMSIGGWTTGASGKGNASENYGRGHRVQMLNEAVDLLQFTDIDIAHLKPVADSSA